MTNDNDQQGQISIQPLPREVRVVGVSDLNTLLDLYLRLTESENYGYEEMIESIARLIIKMANELEGLR